MQLRGSKFNRLMDSIGKMLFKKLRFSPRKPLTEVNLVCPILT